MIRRPPALPEHARVLVAYDPGTRNPGLAFFERPRGGGWVLVGACEPGGDGTVAGAVRSVRAAIWTACPLATRALVAEYPVPLPSRRSAQRDILDLRATVDALIESGSWAGTTRVRPSHWKGQTPKSIAHKRYESVLSREEIEKAYAHVGPDARDAVGIGLWATGRYPVV